MDVSVEVAVNSNLSVGRQGERVWTARLRLGEWLPFAALPSLIPKRQGTGAVQNLAAFAIQEKGFLLA